MILVTGATGHVGRELVKELVHREQEVRIVVRDLARAREVPDGVERVVADFADTEALRAAFEGADQLFLLVPGIAHAPAVNALAAAVSAGIRHVVYLSSYAVAVDPMPAMGRWHHEREQLVHASGIPATVLRPCGFMTNTLDWLPTLREGGYVLDPVGPGKAALIDPADIGAVAAVALTDDGHAGAGYTLTGDQPLTTAEQAAVLAAAAGIQIEVREVQTPEQAVRFRYPDGAPPELAAALVEGLRLMRADTEGLRTDTVRRLLGRPPRSFTDWCHDHAEAFRPAC
ncbi:MAG: Oxidoreductase [Streptosporangiaceae bacterium]|nr:Oxidoreductase [Streptosporangiaceae bacterium]